MMRGASRVGRTRWAEFSPTGSSHRGSESRWFARVGSIGNDAPGSSDCRVRPRGAFTPPHWTPHCGANQCICPTVAGPAKITLIGGICWARTPGAFIPPHWTPHERANHYLLPHSGESRHDCTVLGKLIGLYPWDIPPPHTGRPMSEQTRSNAPLW